MNTKNIKNKIKNAWQNDGMYTAVYTDGSIDFICIPKKANPENLIGVYSNAIRASQIKEDFKAAGVLL